MTKINIRIPEPKEQYDVSNQKQINRALTLMKDQLNSKFLDKGVKNIIITGAREILLVYRWLTYIQIKKQV